jgi:hypothetical protein
VRGIIEREIDSAALVAAERGRMDVEAFTDRLLAVQMAHVAHVDRLNALLERAGAPPVTIPESLKGAVTQDYAYISNVSETGPALIAVQAAEEALLAVYEEAIVGGALDPGLRETLAELRAELAGHLSWMDETLRRGWTAPEVVDLTD